MLYTEGQNQFKVLEENALRGEPMNLEAGYQAAYQEWALKNAEILPKLSAEERAISFSDHVETAVCEQAKILIEEKTPDPTEKKRLLAQASRGDLLLASTDEGAHFNEVLTLKEAQGKNPLDLHLLSSTLRSTTTNFIEVKEEQNLLHIVKKLRDEHFLVENAFIENHTVHAEVTHPKSGKANLTVALNEDSAQPFLYVFSNPQGSKKVPETQLPEQYGEAVLDPSLQPVSWETVLAAQAMKSTSKNKEKENTATRPFLAAMFSNLALKNAKKDKLTAFERGAAEALKVQKQMAAPLIHQNVMAAKTAMAARKARQEKQLTEEKKRIADRFKKYHEELGKKQLQKATARQTVKQAVGKTIAVGTGAAAGLLTGGAGLSFFLAHLAHT